MDSSITENFGVIGGVAYINNDGIIKINSMTKIFKNTALNTCFLFLINTNNTSQMNNILMGENDQKNQLIAKSQFLSQTSGFAHITSTFMSGMINMQEKVQRSIDEITDTAIYLIKAKIAFNNSVISKNDLLLSASTQSIVDFENTDIHQIIDATGPIF